MRHLSLALTVLALTGSGGAAATNCYLPSEIEADQAIKLRTELKVIGEVCKDPGYAIFSDRNRDTLAAYEQILTEHLVRGDAGANAASYAKGLEKAAMERAAQAPGFCADAFDTVTLFAGMRPPDLHAYAVSKAETAKPDYALCSAPAPVDATPGNVPPLVSASVAPEPAGAAPTSTVAAAASVALAPSAPVAAAPPTAVAAPSSVALPSPASAEGDIRPSLGDADLARMLNRANRLRLMETTQQTLESARSGQLLGWRDPASNSGGTVVAARAFQNAESQWCRRFEQSVVVSGEIRRAGGVACRRPDGIWENVP